MTEFGFVECWHFRYKVLGGIVQFHRDCVCQHIAEDCMAPTHDVLSNGTTAISWLIVFSSDFGRMIIPSVDFCISGFADTVATLHFSGFQSLYVAILNQILTFSAIHLLVHLPL